MIIMQGDQKNSAGAGPPEGGGDTSGSKDGAKPRPFEWLGQVGNLVAGLATAGALIFTAFSVQATQDQVAIARQQASTEQQGQVTDRYTKSVEQLGSDKLEVRVGGVYALERIARDSRRDKPAVIDVLTAFTRERPHPESSESVEWSGIDADVQASITVIQELRNFEEEASNNYQLPLDEAPLGGAMLRNANLANVDFRSADFEKADLDGADLRSADLRSAYLGSADLRSADLRSADLSDANLEWANFEGANLDGANLDGANWEDAIGLPPA